LVPTVGDPEDSSDEEDESVEEEVVGPSASPTEGIPTRYPTITPPTRFPTSTVNPTPTMDDGASSSSS